MWFLLAHGAGADSSSAWMLRYRDRLRELGPVETFDYEYMIAGKRRPDPHDKLLHKHRHALIEGRDKHGPDAILVGKSMGGRIGCHLALEEEVRACICLGYPLKGMGKSGKIRDQVLLQLATPTLFVQGTRDQLCPLDLLRQVLSQRKARSELFVVPTGNHSLEPTKTYLKESGRTPDEIEQDTLDAIRAFLKTL